MTDDIVTRLRKSSGEGCTCEAHSYYECGCTEAAWAEMFIEEAADEIESLRAQVNTYKKMYSNEKITVRMMPIADVEAMLSAEGEEVKNVFYKAIHNE